MIQLFRTMLLAAALALATTTAPAPAAADPADDVAARVQAFVEAFNAESILTIGDFYTDGAAILPPENESIIGREAIEALYARRFAAIDAKIEFQVSEIGVFGEHAVVIGVGVTEVPTEEGVTIRTVSRSMHHWTLVNDHWRLHRTMSNIIARGPVAE